MVLLMKDTSVVKLANVDIPREIFDAARSNRLVIFAGAGVSMSRPSSLPSFIDLTEDIARSFGKVYKKKDGLSCDRFLGSLQDRESKKVHRIAAEILSNKTSLPSKLHSKVLECFKPSEVRIITTNYDLHFETAAKNIGFELENVYYAPAVPLGDSFSGVIHLHGSIKEPQNMVLTDVDFGCAYLTRGWARTFLIDVFSNYTTLFIGYSYDDVILQYLSRALPVGSSNNRYILTTEDKEWKQLGVQAIDCKDSKGKQKFSKLNAAMYELGMRLHRDVLAWNSRIKAICIGLPPSDEESNDELKEALLRSENVSMFIREAKDVNWLSWAERNGYLDCMFSICEPSDIDKKMISWAINTFYPSKEAVLLEHVEKNPRYVNRYTWNELARCIIKNSCTYESSVLRRWVYCLLSGTEAKRDTDLLYPIVKVCTSNGCWHYGLKVFCEILRDWEFDAFQGMNHNADYDTLKELWEDHLKPSLSAIAYQAMNSLIQILFDLTCDSDRYPQGITNITSIIGLRRPAIEKNENNRFPEGIDALIDAIRDTLEYLCSQNRELAEPILKQMITSDLPVLRRLSIHTMTECLQINCSEKIQWLIDNIDIFSVYEEHEIFRLIKKNLEKAETQLRERVFQMILSKRWVINDTELGNEVNVSLSDSLRYKWLLGLKEAFIGLPQFDNEIDRLSTHHPGRQIQTEVDFYFIRLLPSKEGGLLNLLGVEQLHKMEPEEVISLFTSPSSESNIAALIEACAKDIPWSITLIRAMLQEEKSPSVLWEAILGAWQRADINFIDGQSIIEILGAPLFMQSYPKLTAELLLSFIKRKDSEVDEHFWSKADIIADMLWNLEERKDAFEDWPTSAINSTYGILIQYWLLKVYTKSASKTDNASVSDMFFNRMESELKKDSFRAGCIRTFLAGKAGELLLINEEWVRGNVLPLFFDKDEEHLEQAWQGYLIFGRLFNKMDGIFENGIKQISKLSDEWQMKLVEKLASYLTFNMECRAMNLIKLFLRNAKEMHIERFFVTIRSALDGIPEGEVENIWSRWLQAFLFGMIDPFYSEKAINEILEMLPLLGEHIPEIVQRVSASRPISVASLFWLTRTNNEEVYRKYHKEFIILIGYLSKCHVQGYDKSHIIHLVKAFPRLDSEARDSLNRSLLKMGLAEIG